MTPLADTLALAPAPAPRPARTPPSADDGADIAAAAREFEAVFIAEMLDDAGLVDAVAGDSGSGGAPFARLLVDRYAEAIAARGGFGLADAIADQIRADRS